MATIALDGASITLPGGWVEHPNPGGPREFRASASGDTGVLQFSQFPDDQLGWFTVQPDLAVVAVDLGKRMLFSDDAASKAGACNMGRYGFAMFRGGKFPAMFLWLVLSRDAAHLWTWLGPDPTSPDAQAAVTIVLGAREP